MAEALIESRQRPGVGAGEVLSRVSVCVSGSTRGLRSFLGEEQEDCVRD